MRTPFLALCLLALTGCAHEHFEAHTPDDFLELDTPGYGAFRYRATSADGVRLAVREERNEGHGSQAFWEQAVRNQLRYEGGYAIQSESAIEAASGQHGMLFKCGKDQHGRTYDYWLAVFVTEERVFVIEAGALHAQFEPAQANVQTAFEALEID